MIVLISKCVPMIMYFIRKSATTQLRNSSVVKTAAHRNSRAAPWHPPRSHLLPAPLQKIKIIWERQLVAQYAERSWLHDKLTCTGNFRLPTLSPHTLQRLESLDGTTRKIRVVFDKQCVYYIHIRVLIEVHNVVLAGQV